MRRVIRRHPPRFHIQPRHPPPHRVLCEGAVHRPVTDKPGRHRVFESCPISVKPLGQVGGGGGDRPITFAVSDHAMRLAFGLPGARGPVRAVWRDSHHLPLRPCRLVDQLVQGTPLRHRLTLDPAEERQQRQPGVFGTTGEPGIGEARARRDDRSAGLEGRVGGFKPSAVELLDLLRFAEGVPGSGHEAPWEAIGRIAEQGVEVPRRQLAEGVEDVAADDVPAQASILPPPLRHAA